jgi:protein ImuA
MPGSVEGLSALKRKIAAIAGTPLRLEDGGPRVLPLEVAGIDAALSGGLALGAIHEIEPAAPVHCGAAFGFALALAGRATAGRRTDELLWVETAFATAECGRLYGLGLDAFGLSPARVLIVRVKRPLDVLWVMEEALRCRGIAATIAELTEAPDLTATRRLSLAAREAGGLGLLARHGAWPQASAAMTRWQVAAAPSRPADALGGLGRAAFDLRLTKNRHGPCGRWTILWDHHDCAFRDPALSFGMAALPFERSARALRRAG